MFILPNINTLIGKLLTYTLHEHCTYVTFVHCIKNLDDILCHMNLQQVGVSYIV